MPAIKTIPAEEWDFREHRVPSTEAQACAYYEYARENNTICRLFEPWRKEKTKLVQKCVKGFQADPHGPATWDALLPMAIFYQSFHSKLARLAGDPYLAHMLMECPGFPDEPWQKLAPALRHKLSADQGPESSLLHRRWRGGVKHISYEEFLKHRTQYQVGLSSGHFGPDKAEAVLLVIDWRGGVNKAVQSFTAWAQQYYKAKGVKKISRPPFAEWLKQLGVLRLYQHLGSWPKVTKFIGKPPLYADENTYSRAAAQARARIKTIFPLSHNVNRSGLN